MSPTTPPPPACSITSGKVWVLRPSPSRWLALWWWAVHAAAAVGLVASALPAPLAGAGLAVLLGHVWLRRPGPAPALAREPDGHWALPDAGRGGLSLRAGTSVGPFWVDLRLAGPGGRVAVLLLRDQLDRESWRALQAELRRGGRGGH